MSGGVLLSHPVTRAVPSALKGLASGFGMGPGVSPSLLCRRNSMELWSGLPFRKDTPTASREPHSGRVNTLWSSPRPISTGQLHALPHFHFRPINPLIWRGPYQVDPVGDLILKRASRLDAFSGYPFRT
jgi:hypothetical protein